MLGLIVKTTDVIYSNVIIRNLVRCYNVNIRANWIFEKNNQSF